MSGNNYKCNNHCSMPFLWSFVLLGNNSVCQQGTCLAGHTYDRIVSHHTENWRVSCFIAYVGWAGRWWEKQKCVLHLLPVAVLPHAVNKQKKVLLHFCSGSSCFISFVLTSFSWQHLSEYRGGGICLPIASNNKYFWINWIYFTSIIRILDVSPKKQPHHYLSCCICSLRQTALFQSSTALTQYQNLFIM